MLEIAITIDIDADVFDQSLQADSYQSQQPEWKGAEQGIPPLSALLKMYSGSDQQPCIATWFVRADDQVGYYHTDNAYLFERFYTYWTALANEGHEIAWHPHLYKLENGNWIQETDPQALLIQMDTSLKAVRSKGWKVTSSRIGEAYFSDAISQVLPSLGILCDSSALPGRERKDNTRNIDWLITPFTPYYPSLADYRVPGTPHVPLLEIPFSMVEVAADYDLVPLKRYVDLSFWHRALKKGLEQAIQNNTVLNCIVHPSAIVPTLESKPHGLLSYSLNEVKRNIDFIVETAAKNEIPYGFRTISQLYKRISYEQR
jgi:hypothetical protein